MDYDLPDYTSTFGEVYQNEANALLQLFKNAKVPGNCTTEKIIENYVCKFTMLPIFWKKWISFGSRNNGIVSCMYTKLKSQNHFPVNDYLINFFFDYNDVCLLNSLNKYDLFKANLILPPLNKPFPYKECFFWIESKKDFDCIYYHTLQALKCPHSNLDENLIYCLAFSNSPQTAMLLQIYTKNFKLYNELILADENEDQWLNCLRKSDNIECIIQNIEYRISLEPANVKLWKFLINVLEELNQNVLPIYKRYCHLFLNDKEMRKMYRKAIGKFSHHYQTKWWIDLIEIEKDFETEESASELMKSIIQNEFGQNFIETHAHYDFNECFKLFKNFAKIKDTEIIFVLKKSEELPYIPYQNITSIYSTIFNFSIPQNFCFPSFIINYIIKQQNSYNLQNLKMSCKFFLYKIRAIYCHMLVVHEKHELEKYNMCYSKQSIFTHNFEFLKNYKNFCITNSFIIHHHLDQYIAPKFHNCGIRYISLAHQKLNYSHFLFLTSSGKVEYLHLTNVKIIHENSQEASMEEILTLVPKARNFYFKYRHTTAKIFDHFLKTLVKYRHPVTLKVFEILNVSDYYELNATQFYIFMMNNASKNSHFLLEFETCNLKDTFKTTISQFLESCWTIHESNYALKLEHRKNL